MQFSKIISSPIELLQIIASENAITQINFEKKITTLPLNSNKIIDKATAELNQYFLKQLKQFSVAINPHGSDFQKATWQLLQTIEYGKTISYKQLADRYGNPLAIRALANANGKNPIPIIIPCHRVIGSNGKLVGFSGGLDIKENLLKHEGVLNQLAIFY